MSKSVLVIDTPGSCSECLFREMSHCIIAQEMIDKINCPLTPLPSHKDLSHYIQRGDSKSMTHLMMSIHDAGYNQCLDDLQKGETNDSTRFNR